MWKTALKYLREFPFFSKTIGDKKLNFMCVVCVCECVNKHEYFSAIRNEII